MSYSNCGYPNMSIKKFCEKWTEVKLEYDSILKHYHIYIPHNFIRIRLFNFHLDTRQIEFLEGMLGKWNGDFMDDIRLLYKYLLKEYKKREELKRKRKKNEKVN